jgi:hypothetical protein
MISTLPERDQEAVIWLIDSLIAAGVARANGALREPHFSAK